MSKVLPGLFDPFAFRGHPNFGMWLRIQQLVATRPPGSISITNVKSHQSNPLSMEVEESWKATGNDHADRLAKSTLTDHLTMIAHENPDWKALSENRRLDQAFLATQFLHEVSTHVFQTRNSRTPEDPQEVLQPNGESPAQAYYEPFLTQIPNSFPGKKWDHRWLTLVCHPPNSKVWNSLLEKGNAPSWMGGTRIGAGGPRTGWVGAGGPKPDK